MLRKISLIVIALAIIVMGALRFYKLDTIPYGYHVDEVSGAVTMHCFVTQGCDAEITPWPLFGFIQYGQDKPPTYIYPGIVWGKIFGTTVPSYRAYGVFVFTLGLIGLFFLGRVVGGLPLGLVSVLAASCSPWMWVVGRVLMESYFAPVFVIWAMYFLWRSTKWWDWAGAGFLFACAMYSYPPARMQVPVLMITLAFYDGIRGRIRWSSFWTLTSVFILSLLPMVPQYLHGPLGRRFNLISIFNKNYLSSIGSNGSLSDVFAIFGHNYMLHLSPDFLFRTGDPSYVHSTRHLGLLSWFDMGALLIFVGFVILAIFNRKISNPLVKQGGLMALLIINIFLGIIPAALTNQELPHSLRISGSWPMMMLFSGLMWCSLVELLSAFWPLLVLTALLSSGVLIYQYFGAYAQESKGMFDYWIKDSAEKLQSQEDWEKFLLVFHRRNYHIRYFLVHRLGFSCKDANTFWWRLHDQLDKEGKF